MMRADGRPPATLGDVFYVDSVRINLGVFQSDVNVIWDLGPHDISIIDYVLGGILPNEVCGHRRGACRQPAENIAYLTMRYGPNVRRPRARQLAGAGQDPTHHRRRLEADDRLRRHAAVREAARLRQGRDHRARDDPEQIYSQLVSYRSGDVRAPRLDDREALAVEVDEIVGAIGGGSMPVADAALGLRTVRILEAAERSARDGSARSP